MRQDVGCDPGARVAHRQVHRLALGCEHHVDLDRTPGVTFAMVQEAATEVKALFDELEVRIGPLRSNVSRGILRRLRGFDVLWVHGYARLFNLGAMLTAKRLGMKVMLRDEATPISMPRGPAKKIAKRGFFAGLWTLVDAALAIGSLNRRYYLEQGFRPDRIFSVPYAVDNARFQTGAKAAASLE